jgi:hypothetical protein
MIDPCTEISQIHDIAKDWLNEQKEGKMQAVLNAEQLMDA